MKPGSQLTVLARRPSAPLLAVSLAAWVLLFVFDGQAPLATLCLSSVSRTPGPGLEAQPYSIAALSWSFMVATMMLPLLTQPIAQLRLRSFQQRRNRSVTLFVAGYVAVWMTAGLVLLPAVALLGRLADRSALPAWIIAIVLAAIWQVSPLRQRALNRCHRLPRLSAFGAAADRDCAGFGLNHGFWCTATCAPWMVLVLATPTYHLPLMLALSAGIVLERMLPARPPSWSFRVLPGLAVAAMLVRRIRATPHHRAQEAMAGTAIPS